MGAGPIGERGRGAQCGAWPANLVQDGLVGSARRVHALCACPTPRRRPGDTAGGQGVWGGCGDDHGPEAAEPGAGQAGKLRFGWPGSRRRPFWGERCLLIAAGEIARGTCCPVQSTCRLALRTCAAPPRGPLAQLGADATLQTSVLTQPEDVAAELQRASDASNGFQVVIDCAGFQQTMQVRWAAGR